MTDAQKPAGPLGRVKTFDRGVQAAGGSAPAPEGHPPNTYRPFEISIS